MSETSLTVSAGEISFGNHLPFVLIGGINVLESEQFAVDVAGHYRDVCHRLSIPCNEPPLCSGALVFFLVPV